jgi:hypothetical protein
VPGERNAELRVSCAQHADGGIELSLSDQAPRADQVEVHVGVKR